MSEEPEKLLENEGGNKIDSQYIGKIINIDTKIIKEKIRERKVEKYSWKTGI